MKKIKYSEKDMAALISEVESQFTNHLAKAEKSQATDLKKSEVVEQPKAEEVQVVEAAAPVEQGFDYDEEDIKEMNEMYSSMTKAEAEAHFESLKKVISKEDEDTSPIAKTEEKSEVKEEKEETELLKSEVETLKSDKEKLEKSLKDLTAALAKYVKGTSAPKQKAITRIEYVAKSEEEVKTEEKKEDLSKLDKVEISKRLTSKIRSGKLEKAEREKINEYYQTGSQNIESIRHLLTGGN